MSENLAQFEQRKKDHIRIALDPKVQAFGLSGLNQIQLIHEALPEMDFSEIDISIDLFGEFLKSPIFISSMTAGHADSLKLNERLIRCAEKKGWMLGVGSQRKELFFKEAEQEWRQIRKMAPRATICGNIGLAQVIHSEVSKIKALVENLEAKALFIHLNPLQEIIQSEGTPNFRGGLRAIENLVQRLQVPILIKEVGCGISAETVKKLSDIGVFAVDVAGLGGTHWGRVEQARLDEQSIKREVAETFLEWGIPTVRAFQDARLILGEKPRTQVWASGGVRTGLDVAKLLAMGAQMVGVASPILKAALESEETLLKLMTKFESELKIAMFCTGVQNLSKFKEKKVWYEGVR